MGSLVYIVYRVRQAARGIVFVLIPLYVRCLPLVCRARGHDDWNPDPEVVECRRCRRVEGPRHAIARLRNDRLTEWMRWRAEQDERAAYRRLAMQVDIMWRRMPKVSAGRLDGVGGLPRGAKR